MNKLQELNKIYPDILKYRKNKKDIKEIKKKIVPEMLAMNVALTFVFSLLGLVSSNETHQIMGILFFIGASFTLLNSFRESINLITKKNEVTEKKKENKRIKDKLTSENLFIENKIDEYHAIYLHMLNEKSVGEIDKNLISEISNIKHNRNEKLKELHQIYLDWEESLKTLEKLKEELKKEDSTFKMMMIITGIVIGSTLLSAIFSSAYFMLLMLLAGYYIYKRDLSICSIELLHDNQEASEKYFRKKRESIKDYNKFLINEFKKISPQELEALSPDFVNEILDREISKNPIQNSVKIKKLHKEINRLEEEVEEINS